MMLHFAKWRILIRTAFF